MSNGKKTVSVRIMGKSYTLRAGDDPDYVRSVAEYVDKKMRSISRGAANVPQADAAILAAVNIADELHKARRRVASLEAGGASGKKGGESKSAADPAEWGKVGEKIQSILDALPE
jgi:cell division protein ZapA